jgi:hypothetical protein
MTQKETLEMLKNICRNCLANEPSDPTEREIGYSAAMEHIIKIIDDNTTNLIGKYGYFWDDDKSNVVYYSKLLSIIDREDYFYVDNTKNEFQNFSLTIPEHLK